jgi:hypothetical protein
MKSNSSMQPVAETFLQPFSNHSLLRSTGYQTLRALSVGPTVQNAHNSTHSASKMVVGHELIRTLIRFHVQSASLILQLNTTFSPFLFYWCKSQSIVHHSPSTTVKALNESYRCDVLLLPLLFKNALVPSPQ